jgi:hypothetical protein
MIGTWKKTGAAMHDCWQLIGDIETLILTRKPMPNPKPKPNPFPPAALAWFWVPKRTASANTDANARRLICSNPPNKKASDKTTLA